MTQAYPCGAYPVIRYMDIGLREDNVLFSFEFR